ncbi:hypothetical protein PR202_gb19417 [Eleusine coracana subsp. coracana]|uniref:Glyoxalase/fosfomycin resistance/dioxygenase domain-containing protein n=1 Tax=Eleusine coracana subsp. coracana TaxID=191504 RepID=A0AAV5F5Y5_ELECO|nr:hypothetical protein QOZ80_3BG0285100 [Eleusine coracana subsp. coracana]GJN31063.1 hypothetical protein PR202_gb19417 [Eleusine coracana subsp. coracana]
MASGGGAVRPAFAYTVVYVRDVAKSAAFYSAAFGYSVRRLDESHKWAELESGSTTIAFTPLHQRETEQKNWGQKVGYVRDIDGIIVRIGSHVRE